MNNHEITIAFQNILKRMKSGANKEKYNALVNSTASESKERIWALCEKFWPSKYGDSKEDLDSYVINEDLDPMMARKYLAELETLLDSLGWSKNN